MAIGLLMTDDAAEAVLVVAVKSDIIDFEIV
jgi:hypothetical protein